MMRDYKLSHWSKNSYLHILITYSDSYNLLHSHDGMQNVWKSSTYIFCFLIPNICTLEMASWVCWKLFDIQCRMKVRFSNR